MKCDNEMKGEGILKNRPVAISATGQNVCRVQLFDKSKVARHL